MSNGTYQESRKRSSRRFDSLRWKKVRILPQHQLMFTKPEINENDRLIKTFELCVTNWCNGSHNDDARSRKWNAHERICHQYINYVDILIIALAPQKFSRWFLRAFDGNCDNYRRRPLVESSAQPAETALWIESSGEDSGSTACESKRSFRCESRHKCRAVWPSRVVNFDRLALWRICAAATW